jgi:hypothetical protein
MTAAGGEACVLKPPSWSTRCKAPPSHTWHVLHAEARERLALCCCKVVRVQVQHQVARIHARLEVLQEVQYCRALVVRLVVV